MVVSPTSTVTYTATATGPGGTATASAVVSVVTATYALPNNGTEIFDVGDASGPLTAGSVVLQMTSGAEVPNGNGILSYKQGGVTLVEAAVPALTPILSGRFLAQMDNNTNIGVAFTNPGTNTATISFYFTDTDGVSTAPRTTTLGAGQELSAFLDQSPYNGTKPFLGSFTFTSTVPLAALGIKGYFNERGEFLFTTSPVAPLGVMSSLAASDDQSFTTFPASLSEPLVIPFYALGGGWTTEVILTNPTDSALAGTLQFVNSDGGPAMTLVSGVVNSSFNYTVPPRSAYRLFANNANNTISTGSIRVTPAASSGTPAATAVFAYKVGGVTVSESSVSASPRSTAYRLYVESSGTSSTRSGVAITNASDAPVTVQLELLQMDGQRVGVQTPPALPAGGQLSRFIDELFTNLPTTFRGTLRVSVSPSFGAPLVVTGIRARINERNDFLFAATPASDESAPPYTGNLVFTHVVYGGGYSTQLILYGDSPGASGGRLINLSKDGTVLPSGSLRGTALTLLNSELP
jgi:hypothetical protein